MVKTPNAGDQETLKMEAQKKYALAALAAVMVEGDIMRDENRHGVSNYQTISEMLSSNAGGFFDSRYGDVAA